MTKLTHISSNIHKFQLGKVVAMVPLSIMPLNDDVQKHSPERILEYGTSEGTVMKVGHVIGFGMNSHNEIIVNVKWADGGESTIHPHNLKFLD